MAHAPCLRPLLPVHTQCTTSRPVVLWALDPLLLPLVSQATPHTHPLLSDRMRLAARVGSRLVSDLGTCISSAFDDAFTERDSEIWVASLPLCSPAAVTAASRRAGSTYKPQLAYTADFRSSTKLFHSPSIVSLRPSIVSHSSVCSSALFVSARGLRPAQALAARYLFEY